VAPVGVFRRPARCAAPVVLAIAALVVAALGGGRASAAGATAPCSPRAVTVAGHRATAFCGPAAVTIDIGGRTYRYRHGLCDLSATMGGLELDAGTLVPGATGNAGRPFVSIVLAHSPSESQALTAYAGGQQLFTDTVIVQGGPLYTSGTFTSVLGGTFSGSWDCHGVIYRGR